MPLKKIVSGGQTGADIAGIEAAIAQKTPYGGWLPKGRLTEDGPLSAEYNLQEMPTDAYPKRTAQNVIDSDGTVIFTHGSLTGGSLLTRKKAVQHGRPVLHLDLSKTERFDAALELADFIEQHDIQVLNVAGNRGRKDPPIYDQVFKVMYSTFIITQPWLPEQVEQIFRGQPIAPENQLNCLFSMTDYRCARFMVLAINGNLYYPGDLTGLFLRTPEIFMIWQAVGKIEAGQHKRNQTG